MSIESGQTLLHYRLIEKIGEGGMGMVWKAVDTTLDREVAIKILPEAFAEDAERLARFEREAKVLASLNHSNIAAVYGIHVDSQVRFLAMEFVEGEDISQRLMRGPIDVEQTLKLGAQIAEALEVAHEAGVIHRDIKPANIVVTPAGQVKVLDFGLAKALSADSGPGAAEASSSMSPTMTSAGTLAGAILGTASYMSPEQARGQAIDRRADIWSYGCVLYEMLTGRRLFEGQTVSDTLAAVLRASPDFDALPPGTPPELRRIVRRCLERDPRNRLRDIGEARVTLSTVDTEVSPDVRSAEPPKRGLSPIVGSAIALAAIVIGVFAGRSFFGPAPIDLPERKLLLATPVGVEGPRLRARISPDGGTLAYIASGKLWVHPLDSLTPRPVLNGEGATEVAWSPDSRSLVFTVRSKVWRTAVNGEPVLLCEIPNAIGAGGGLAWTETEEIVYATGDDNVYTIPVAGGEPKVLVAPDPTEERDFHGPSRLPGGGVVFVVHGRDGAMNEVHAYRNGERKPAFTLDRAELENPVYSPTGHLVFSEAESKAGLWAVPYSLERLEATGEPFRITDKGSEPQASEDGTLLYSNVPNVGQHQLVLTDRNGEVLAEFGEMVPHADNLTLSADESKFAVCVIDVQGEAIWVYDLERNGTRSRIASNSNCGGARGQSAWTPDGKILAMGNAETQMIRLFGVEGASAEHVFTEGEQPTFTRDGRYMIFVRMDQAGQEDLYSMELRENIRERGEVQKWIERPGRQESPQASPANSLVAYVSDESGRKEVYLRTFPDRGQTWQVSFSGGVYPRWSSDGKKLFYLQDELVVMESQVEFSDGPTVSARLTDPQELFAGDVHRLAPNHGWDVAGNGEQFLTVEFADLEVGVRDLTLITGWSPQRGAGRR